MQDQDLGAWAYHHRFMPRGGPGPLQQLAGGPFGFAEIGSVRGALTRPKLSRPVALAGLEAM